MNAPEPADQPAIAIEAPITGEALRAGKKHDILEYFNQLQQASEVVSKASFSVANSGRIATSHQTTNDIGAWHSIMEKRRESELIKVVALEHEFA
jgi:hypothetical protein